METGLTGIMECWNAGAMIKPVSIVPIFHHSILPLFLLFIIPFHSTSFE